MIIGNEPINPLDYDLYGYKNSRSSGLTIRQYYAGLAMQGLLASFTEKAANGMWGAESKETAEASVRLADALIAALNATPNQ